MDYTTVAEFAQTWGLVYMFAIFIGVLIYAFRPSAQKKFDRAAQIPLKED
ncbi:MAG: cbb3-type cytochrome c oxidase subunit 3 [Rhodospirillales bacterium]|nr:cbb3-type cytochrome c oxidase subunit 3 [Rhodospirillales bacterium]MBO6788463.1 cbb3-type cytochrome c oxidase subunit 3 [Rhodospirillales bacterium]